MISWRDMTSAQAEEAFGPMVADATSVVRGTELVRTRADWREIVVWWLPGHRALHVNMTVSELFRSGAYAPLLPKPGRDLGTLKRDRASARRLCELVGDVRVANVTEALVMRVRRRLFTEGRAKTGRSLGRACCRRDLALLRRAARWFATLMDLDSSDPVQARGQRRRRRRWPRAEAPRRWEPREALAGMGSVLGGLSVVLSAGCGVRSAERERLLPADIVRLGKVFAVWVAGPRSREVGRWVVVPAWGTAVVERALAAHKNPGEPLFPAGSDHTLRVALARSYSGPRDATFRYFRRRFQAVARANKLPSGLLRGSWQLHFADLGHPGYARAFALAAKWTDPARAPNEAKVKRWVPRRAPKGTAPDAPELDGIQVAPAKPKKRKKTPRAATRKTSRRRSGRGGTSLGRGHARTVRPTSPPAPPPRPPPEPPSWDWPLSRRTAGTGGFVPPGARRIEAPRPVAAARPADLLIALVKGKRGFG